VVDELLFRLFLPRWEAREGAAMALAEVVRAAPPAMGAGVGAPGRGGRRLEDLVTRCLALLLLDRADDFGDGGRSTAPVRSAASSLLAECVSKMTPGDAARALRKVEGVAAAPSWQARHGTALVLARLARAPAGDAGDAGSTPARVAACAVALCRDASEDVAMAAGSALGQLARCRPEALSLAMPGPAGASLADAAAEALACTARAGAGDPPGCLAAMLPLAGTLCAAVSAAGDQARASVRLCRHVLPLVLAATAHPEACVRERAWRAAADAVFSALPLARPSASALDVVLRVCARAVVSDGHEDCAVAAARCLRGCLDIAEPAGLDVDAVCAALASDLLDAAATHDGAVPVAPVAGCPPGLERRVARVAAGVDASAFCALLRASSSSGVTQDSRVAVCAAAAAVAAAGRGSLCRGLVRRVAERAARLGGAAHLSLAEASSVLRFCSFCAWPGLGAGAMDAEALEPEDGDTPSDAATVASGGIAASAAVEARAPGLWGGEDATALGEADEVVSSASHGSAMLQVVAALAAAASDDGNSSVAHQGRWGAQAGLALRAASEAAGVMLATGRAAQLVERGEEASRAVESLGVSWARQGGGRAPTLEAAVADRLAELREADPGSAEARALDRRWVALRPRLARAAATLAGDLAALAGVPSGAPLTGVCSVALEAAARPGVRPLMPGCDSYLGHSLGLAASRARGIALTGAAWSATSGLEDAASQGDTPAWRRAVVDAAGSSPAAAAAVLARLGARLEETRATGAGSAAVLGLVALSLRGALSRPWAVGAERLAAAARELAGPVISLVSGGDDDETRRAAGMCFGLLVRAGALLSSRGDGGSGAEPTAFEARVAAVNRARDMASRASMAEESPLQRAREAVLDAEARGEAAGRAGMPRHRDAGASGDAAPAGGAFPAERLPEACLPGGDFLLRPYQEAGALWALQMRRLGVGAMLCDDMGLGKTAQALCATAAADDGGGPARTLVVCPSSVVRHWSKEAAALMGGRVRTAEYAALAGRSAGRADALAAFLGAPSGASPVVVVSYNMLRRDAEGLRAACAWTSIVFDEVHALRNPDSAVAGAARRLRGLFRLGLTGTPVHNSPVDLWAVFDAVSPGLLGDRPSFEAGFHRPVRAASREGASAALHASAAAALRSLHSLIRPFVVRRTKAAVLPELPPKVIQDVPCELSGEQRRAYDAFVGGDGAALLDSAAAAGVGPEDADGGAAARSHPLALVSRLRQICNHASLASSASATGPFPISSSGKLLALHSLLEQCGLSLGRADDERGDEATAGRRDDGDQAGQTRAARKRRAGAGGSSSAKRARLELADDHDAALLAGSALAGERHRVLIFSQSRRMLDLVRSSVLGPYFPAARFGRIDGTVQAGSRQDVVDRFNGSGELDGVLLTTATGGVGLTLTGADVVVFLDHDWNPVNDLQAMDRAHRIGQTRTVHVFRLVAQDTLEERIMGLQAFKRRVAEALVSADGESDCATDVAAAVATLRE